MKKYLKLTLFITYTFLSSAVFAQNGNLESIGSDQSKRTSKEISASNRMGFLNTALPNDSTFLVWSQYFIFPALDFDIKRKLIVNINSMMLQGFGAVQISYGLTLDKINSHMAFGVFAGRNFLLPSGNYLDAGPFIKWTVGSNQTNMSLSIAYPHDFGYYNKRPATTFAAQVMGTKKIGIGFEFAKLNYANSEGINGKQYSGTVGFKVYDKK